jgi:hypothetical protein
MKSFDEYKIDCKYFERESIPRKNYNGSFLECRPIIIENCNHPLAGKSKEVTSKTCNENNDFCPYKELNN